MGGLEGGAYLVSYYRPARRSCVCCDDDAAIVDAADDGRAGGCGFR